ncbi:MAG: trypsin-like serine protease, partial [Myxococcales bacterium]|nr:trypsin-like serine protease [Myxococcales bacterium]
MSSSKHLLALSAAFVMASAGCAVDSQFEDETEATEEEVDASSSEIVAQLLPEAFFDNATSCWEGPNICEKKKMLVGGCDNRNPGPTTSAGVSPWQSVGRLSNGCTGTLITSKHVLTAAHCIVNETGAFTLNKLHFRLGQTDSNSYPYGTHYAKRVFLPEDYDADSGTESAKVLDYAVVELKNPIPGATPMTL